MNKKRFIPISILLFGLGYFSSSPINNFIRNLDNRKSSKNKTTKITALDIKGDPSIGRKDSVLSIIQFVDFECPYSKHFVNVIYPKLKTEYIEKGLIRLINKDLPMPFHKSAYLAAKVARCSIEQNNYKKVYEALFDNQKCLSCIGAKEISIEAGNNPKSLEECLKNNKIGLAINSNISEAKINNIQGTPSFIIYDSKNEKLHEGVITGVLPWNAFKRKIDNSLNKVSKN
tara:strand:+ start:3918 stop:4607 length:690 start_codon:yes stop_codon:yes gene_type:complete